MNWTASGSPYPWATIQRAPSTRGPGVLRRFTFRKPPRPTPLGTCSKRASTSRASLGSTSAQVRGVRRSRTPQLMSNPTPPGEITPSWSGSVAATPPMGKPYPQWTSGMAME